VSCVLSRSIYPGESNAANGVAPVNGINNVRPAFGGFVNRFRPRPQPRPQPQPVLPQPQQQQQYSPSTLIIYYDEGIGSEPLMKAIEDYNAEIIYKYNNFSSMAIKIPSDKTLDEAIKYFENVNGVLMVNKDQVYQITPINV